MGLSEEWCAAQEVNYRDGHPGVGEFKKRKEKVWDGRERNRIYIFLA